VRLSVHALIVFCVVFLAGTAAAQAASPARLLAKYQPVTQFDTDERFRPTTVASFVADSNLETRNAAGAWVVRSDAPHVASLPVGNTPICTAYPAYRPCWRLNQRTCIGSAGLAGVDCYLGAWRVPPPPSVVYGRVVSGRRAVVLQYWYFYYDNFYSYRNPPDDFIWQAHEGDWEVVNVVLGRAGRAIRGAARRLTPRFVGLSQHCTGQRRAWRRVLRWRATHPIVRVALGSHAGYFGLGEHTIAEECIPPEVIAFLEQRGLPLPRDFTSRGARAGPRAFGAEVTRVRRLGKPLPRWTRFPGRWGEGQFVHGPAPVGTHALGLSPAGPAFQDVWRRPLGTLASWPLS
jgi:hypothetical protein